MTDWTQLSPFAWLAGAPVPVGLPILGGALLLLFYGLYRRWIRIARAYPSLPPVLLAPPENGPLRPIPSGVAAQQVETGDRKPPSALVKALPTGGFGLKTALAFGGIAAVLLYLSPLIFQGFGYLVERIGGALYWPLPWPETGAILGTETRPDLFFVMFLTGILAFVAAFLATPHAPIPNSRRVLLGALVFAYPPTAATVDSLLATLHLDSFTATGTLLLRALLGGSFLIVITFVALVAPRPLRVERLFPRDRVALALFAASVGFAIAAAFALLYELYLHAGIGHDLLTFAVLLLLPIYSFILWTLVGFGLYRWDVSRHRLPSPGVFHPTVSVIIPAFNEEANIASTIESCDAAASRYPGPVEVLVGNDGSTDRTLTVAAEAIARLRHAGGAVVDLAHGGKSHALNGLLLAARGDILVRVDADCRIDPATGFTALVPHFADAEVGGVQGGLLPLQREGWTRKLRAMEICWNHFFLRRGQMYFRAAQVVDGAFCAFRRRDVARLGGWTAWNGEDTEVSLRLERAGFKLRYEPGAIAYEDVPKDYRELKKQRVRWTRGGYFAHQRHMSALAPETVEFGGLALLSWCFFFLRGGVRSQIYLYAALVTAILGLPTLLHLSEIIALLTLPRLIIIGAWLARLGRARELPWLAAWPVTAAVKQFITADALGTMLPGAVGESSE